LKETTSENILDNFNTFMANGKEWEEVNEQIVAARSSAVQEPFPAIAELTAIVPHEIEFQTKLWQGDYETAMGAAERILGGLTDPALRGYRAIWHYLSGSAAWLGAETGIETLRPKARAQFAEAKGAATGIPWLVALARYQPSGASRPEPAAATVVREQFSGIFWLHCFGPLRAVIAGRENRRMTDAVHDQHWRLAARAIMTAS
jgi:hypothetical protein